MCQRFSRYVHFHALGSLRLGREGLSLRCQQARLEALRRIVAGDLLPLSRVAIHGLQRKADLNETRGICLEFARDTGRWLVSTDHWWAHQGTGAALSIKAENLRTIGRISRPMTSSGTTRGGRIRLRSFEDVQLAKGVANGVLTEQQALDAGVQGTSDPKASRTARGYSRRSMTTAGDTVISESTENH